VDSTPYDDREQTAVKHEILARYLSAFVPIVGDWASDIAYIDCFAGPWKSTDPNLADTSFSRAIHVLRSTRSVLKSRGKSPTMHCLLVEREPVAFGKLQQFCERISDLEVTTKNWDFMEHVKDIAQFATERRSSFPFIFIDPKGWEPLEINLIQPLLAVDPGEVLITFMTSWILRFLSDSSKRFDRIFGPDWNRLASLQGEEQEDEVVSSYATSVRKAGHFNYVCTLPVMKPTQDAFQFHMIYATRHVKGVEVFKAAEKHTIPFMHETRAKAQERRRFLRSGQHSMFDATASYREMKYTRHQLRNLAVAKAELRSKLQAELKVLYDDAWATAMQHSGVMDADFREWIQEWKNAGLLQITNQAPRQRLARRGNQQYLRWNPGP
jgi:three-Cys-motif partner protein